jgi:hypothetical protein
MVSRRAILMRKRYAEDPEYRNRKLQKVRAHRAAHKDEINARRREQWRVDLKILQRYGISSADRARLLARQGGVCAICRQKSDRPLCIDHCHVLKTVRGLLCHKCNLGLGMFDDDIDRLRAAIAYLENSRREASGDTAPMDGRDGGNSFDQEGAHMTPTENTGPLGLEPLSKRDLDIVVDAPPIAPDQCRDAAATAPIRAEPAGEGFTPLDLDELLALDIPERGMVLDPIIPEKGLALLYAVRGTGKTHVALGIAHAVATGGRFLNWQAPKPRRVLLVDGEMPAADLRDRLKTIVSGTGVAAGPRMLQVLAGDLRDDGIGNLARPQVQSRLERCLHGVDLLILDNLASLIAGQRENDADSWTTMQQWLLRLRRRGVSVLVVHHAGKNGEQRGVSNREDLLDTSISLRRPSDYSPAEGARFEVHVAKGRGLRGRPALPFEAMLETRADQATWTVKAIEDVESARVKALLADGLSIRDIAEETGIARSTVHRLKKKLERDAEIDPAGTAEN